MSTRQVTRVYFPNPPEQYTQRSLAAVQQAYEQLVRQLQNPGDERLTNLTLTALQSGSDQGLAPGDVYEKDGFLKIALADKPNLAGVSGTTALGSVTVTIT